MSTKFTTQEFEIAIVNLDSTGHRIAAGIDCIYAFSNVDGHCTEGWCLYYIRPRLEHKVIALLDGHETCVYIDEDWGVSFK